ncbi:unnamed protein product [Ilex paraguariensis]|uniref:Uncharacterized protein n=1 Tax=Ilex paraguariensis TaxID=185542 RepID=A0ABC8UPR6_9AQUA
MGVQLVLSLSSAAMEFIVDFIESSSSSNMDEKVEPGELLEESWFFGSFPKMSRCYSDPCPSANYGDQEMFVRKSTGENSSSTPGRDQSVENPRKGRDFGERKAIPPSSLNKLVRAPSLPPCTGREEIQDLDSEFTMSKLIRQASLSTSDMLPPRRASKAMTQSSSIPRHRKKPELESINMGSFKETRRGLMDQTKMRKKSPSDLEYQEVQGVRDLGFTFEKEEKSRIEAAGEEEFRRPYLSEKWQVQSSAPQVPNWVGKSSAEDMKEQIKFWARAVASNVR